MIKLEKCQTVGWDPTVRGMRNPMNSWDKSDSKFSDIGSENMHDIFEDNAGIGELENGGVEIGPNDLNLMMRLVKAGRVDAKFRRMITVYVDITAPLYWWKEFDTYKVGTVSNSCSTMHKIHAKEFTMEDFSHEHLYEVDDPEGMNYSGIAEELLGSTDVLAIVIEALNYYRKMYLDTNDKAFWWQMIQLLPTSYNQKRTVMLNYEVLSNIYQHRRNHKLDEWREMCKWIEELPYSEIITLDSIYKENEI